MASVCHNYSYLTTDQGAFILKNPGIIVILACPKRMEIWAFVPGVLTGYWDLRGDQCMSRQGWGEILLLSQTEITPGSHRVVSSDFSC